MSEHKNLKNIREREQRHRERLRQEYTTNEPRIDQDKAEKQNKRLQEWMNETSS